MIRTGSGGDGSPKKVGVSVLHRMDTAEVNALLFATRLRNYCISGDCPDMLIGVSHEDGGVTSSQTGEETSLRRVETTRKSAGHEYVLV